ncbi:hypothetical protein [Mucilaginibacter terrae]|uniref:ABC-2 type transport system permease protein n=1 Tax=Mucilaginibacter terrae TaxID=1955052 RepID=A0ABU3GU40_9SPHI|nr:hypothetical protein [Mucilaginibacter terrae]MDT3403294.1 ABC-2 type transport system permease protein [Mucilaginibacter terrae]
MNKILLKMVNPLMPLLQKTGVDTYQLHHILRVKLLMDDRRPNNAFGQARKSAEPGKTTNPWLVSFFTALMGLFLGLFLFMFDIPFIGQTIYFSMFMVLISLTLITDFTNVLFDVREQFILLPRPINDRTLAVARIMHISIYVFRLAFLQGLAGIIIVGFTDGLLAAPLFVLQLILATFLSILFVNIVYLLLMRSVTPQRFKDIISYFQIAFSVAIFAAYQILPRLINDTVLAKIQLLSHWWAYLLPPVWITALNEVLIHPGRSNIFTSLMAIAGITLPIVGLWFVARVLAPGFNRRLAAVSTSDSSSNAPAASGTVKKKSTSGFVNKLANLVARNPVENAGFRITWILAARIREFKIKVYPAFGYVPVYFVYFLLNGKGSMDSRVEDIQNGFSYIGLIYMSTFVLSSVLQHISYSEKFKPAWVYYALPITKPGKILAGMYKAVITLYYLPYCAVLSIISIVVWGPKVINDVILATIIGMIYGILMALFMVKGLPFSRPVLLKQSGGRVIISLLIMAFIGAIGFGHYMLVKMGWDTAVTILIIPAALLYFLMMHYYKRQSWDSIELEEF